MRLLIVIVAVLCGVAVFGAEGRLQVKLDQQKEAVYEKELSKISPQAVPLFKEADAALDNNQLDVAAAKLREVLKLAPDFPVALRRMSYLSKDKDQILDFARKAFAKDNSAQYKMCLASALLGFKDDSHLNEALALLDQLSAEAANDVETLAFVAAAYFRGKQTTKFYSTVARLKSAAPESMEACYFNGIALAMQNKASQAIEELKLAKANGFPAAAIDEMISQLTSTAKAPPVWRYAKIAFYCLILWAVGLICLLAAGLILSKTTLNAIASQSSDLTTQPSQGEQKARKAYSVVLSLTAIYYYISIPVVVITVLGGGALLIIGCLYLRHVPVKLVLIVGFFALVSAYAIIKSLLSRVKDEAPGTPIDESQEPAFFAMLNEVAGKIGTPMVDHVYLVPDATAAVYESGSLWKRAFGGTRRCLIIGAGLLNGMSVAQLRSILAHEFGHLNNKDTAGGAMALHVRRSIHASAYSMATGGVASWFNPAWLFMIAFYHIYLRISEGASRLQEVLADRMAAMSYGAKSFVSGLRHSIHRMIEFDLVAQIENVSALKQSRQTSNLYTLEPPADWPKFDEDKKEPETKPVDAQERETKGKAEDKPEKKPHEVVEEAFEQALKQKTSAYDSHPAPRDRIELVERLRNAPDLEDDGTPAWSLFSDPVRLQEAMTSQSHKRFLESIGAAVP